MLLAIVGYLLTKPSTTGNLTGETFTNSMKKDAEKAKDNMENISPKQTDQYQSASEPTQHLQTVEYDITKPYQQDFQVSYQVVEKPRLAGCIASKSTCSCYTQQATKIELSQSDCRRYISGDRPFDYFTQQQQQNHIPTTQPQMQQPQDTKQFDAEYIAQMQEARKQGLI